MAGQQLAMWTVQLRWPLELREELDGDKEETEPRQVHPVQSSILLVPTFSYKGRGRGPDSRQLVSASSSRVNTCVASSSKAARSSSGRGRTNEQEAPPLSQQVPGWIGEATSPPICYQKKKKKKKKKGRAGLRQKTYLCSIVLPEFLGLKKKTCLRGNSLTFLMANCIL